MEMPTVINNTYEIKAVVDHGGMSTIYLAEHNRLHTQWAVKQVKKQPNITFDFLVEADILKSLKHPQLPFIADIYEDEKAVYIVEEYIQGSNLKSLVEKKGTIPEALAIQWLRTLCDVLSYLHNQKPQPIIYRDMKPSNIMLQPDGTLKLIDFGIARTYKKESRADTTFAGTRGFAAPEQFGVKQTDARSDIYSLGATMYYLLTGKTLSDPPYEFVPLRKIDPKFSLGIEYIIARCVQTDPANRYQNVEEILSDLNDIKKFDIAYDQYLAAKRSRKTRIATMLVLSAGLIAAGLYLRANGDRDLHLKPAAQAGPEAAAVEMAQEPDDELRGEWENRGE